MEVSVYDLRILILFMCNYIYAGEDEEDFEKEMGEVGDSRDQIDRSMWAPEDQQQHDEVGKYLWSRYGSFSQHHLHLNTMYNYAIRQESQRNMVRDLQSMTTP